MVILVVFNSFNVAKNLKKSDPVARQMPPFYTTLLMESVVYSGSFSMDMGVGVHSLVLILSWIIEEKHYKE